MAVPGIIPAHAGNTFSSESSRFSCGDHPRACGEHMYTPVCTSAWLGSSPRMRGTHTHAIISERVRGIIPAHAGNTMITAAAHPRCRDHPRACGEHQLSVHWSTSCVGSSPRMRGTRRLAGGAFHTVGIIPAHAGNTFGGLRILPRDRDHPRACGEHVKKSLEDSIRLGSSPRMRGTLGFCCAEVYHFGIIPAHAGNTRKAWREGYAAGDHPRACGEHSSALFEMVIPVGSSPRMRGTPCRYTVHWFSTRDHPRACGEHAILSIKLPLTTGIIPAHAGNTSFR